MRLYAFYIILPRDSNRTSCRICIAFTTRRRTHAEETFSIQEVGAKQRDRIMCTLKQETRCVSFQYLDAKSEIYIAYTVHDFTSNTPTKYESCVENPVQRNNAYILLFESIRTIIIR